jgi:hypothetical protein
VGGGGAVGGATTADALALAEAAVRPSASSDVRTASHTIAASKKSAPPTAVSHVGVFGSSGASSSDGST